MRLFKTIVAALAVTFAMSAVADDPGAFKVPGTDTTIKFNGFAETALFYQFQGGQQSLTTGCDYYLCSVGIGLSKGPQPVAQGTLTSAYTRFGVSTATPSNIGVIGSRVEFDAAKGYQNGGTGWTHSDTIRLRHGYGTIGDWFLMGQTWSTFADLNTFPDQMDENPVMNLAALRSPMIRVTAPAGPVHLTLAVEDPYFSSILAPSGTDNPSAAVQSWSIPDVIARIDLAIGSSTSISVRGVGKQYRVPTASKAGFGAAVGLATKLGDDAFVLDAEGGPGIGTYMWGATLPALLGGTGEDAVVTKHDSIDLWSVWGISADYTRNWTSNVRSNVMASGMWTSSDNGLKNDLDAQVAAGAAGSYEVANKAVYTIGINTYWSPAKSFWLGPEFYWNHRDTFGNGLGNEVRGEFVSHFNFM